jgi:uncharacterized protein
VRLVNKTRSVTVAERVAEAHTFWRRLQGLLGRDGLAPGEGLSIAPCSSIHTFFMRFSIDVAFLDKAGRVVALVPRLRPWRATRAYLSAHSVIELREGTLDVSGTRVGDLLALED